MTNFGHKIMLTVLVLLITPPLGFAAATVNASPLTQTSKVTVKGVVKDAAGAPLLGVTVIVKGTSVGTSTSIDGEYQIQCAADAELDFSFIGYETQTLPVANRTLLNVTLKEDAQLMDEVIVIGYGTTTRRRAVGAVDQIKSEAITERSVANLTQALQGTSPSLVIQQRSSDPADNQLNINIRGIGTMNNNEPLIVIDGLVSDNASFNKLNPSDIENVSVLKDAGTAAIYGSRAANGVLLVTTKKGKLNQAPTVELTAMVGWQQPEVLYTPVQGWQNATLLNISKANSGLAPAFTAEQIRDLKAHGNGTFYMDEILRTAMQQNYNVSVSGGGANTTYMISAGYYDQESNFEGPDYGRQRYNFRTNITTEYKRVKVTALLSYSHENSKTTTDGSTIANAMRIPTYYYYRQYDPVTGKYLLNDKLTDRNSLGLLEEGGYNKYRNDYVNANLSAEVKIIDGLKLRGVLGADIFADHRYTRTHEVMFYNTDAAGNPVGEGRSANNDNKSEDWNKRAYLINSQLMLDFDRTFGKHHVAALLGASNESYTSEANQISFKWADPDLGINGDGTEAVISGDGRSSVTPENTTRTSLTSVFGRAAYDYDNRYYAEFSFRYDGSSKFRSDLRWGFFPSVSLGWRLSQEAFMESYRDNVGDLKIRGSYGTLGNQSVGDYQYFTTYNVYSNTYAFNNVGVGGAGFQLGTDNLQWEVSKTFNVGFDASFFRGKLNLGFDYFNKHTTDILVKPQTPLILGTELQNYNAGEMRTQGWELTLSYALKKRDWSHFFQFNIGDSWNKVLKYEGFEDISGQEEFWRITREGLPFNSYYGYKTDGFFQSYDEIAHSAVPTGKSVKPGDVKFKDRNGDGTIDENDRYYLGNAFPRYTLGFTYNVAWKGIDLSILLQGVLKRDMMVRGELIEPFHSNYGYTMYEHQLDFWTPTNTDARWPRLTDISDPSNQNNYRMGSDLYMFDGSYLRLKNIQLGYTLPERISMKFGVKRFKIYFNAQNLLTFSNCSFIDPESSEFGSNMNSGGANSGRNYPNLRYFGAGLNITF